ncbi:hypothetical protein [Kitasatospora purpeofusca]|uniref:hypothetical protein n=1 Tax=Kitasatospora purpeofusca TaxID=67352 RepID=UPI003F4A9BB1
MGTFRLCLLPLAVLAAVLPAASATARASAPASGAVALRDGEIVYCLTDGAAHVLEREGIVLDAVAPATVRIRDGHACVGYALDALCASGSRSIRMTVAGEGCSPFFAPMVMTSRLAMSRRLISCYRRWRAMESMDSSETLAPPTVLPLAGRLVAFRSAVADDFAFHAGHCRQHGEHDAGGVVRALRTVGSVLVR